VAEEISAKLVMRLRAATGLPMMKCKEALEATGGDFDAAVDHLRKQGLDTAAKKADRAMKEGLVSIQTAPDGRNAAMVLVGCETEPVTQTADFRGLVDSVTKAVLESKDLDAAEIPLAQVLSKSLPAGESVDATLKHLVAKVGENMALLRAARFHSPDGRIGTYLHHNRRTGVLVELVGPKETVSGPAMDAFLEGLRLHIASSRPVALSKEDVPKDLVEKELEIYREQAKQDPKTAGKPPQVVEKIVGGRLERYFAERCLLAQPWIHDDKTTVADQLRQACGKAGVVTIRRFALFEAKPR
jgi:elongation factor Ts